MYKLKKEKIGQLTSSVILNGMIEICEKNIPILLQDKRYDLFEPAEVKPLVEVKKEVKKKTTAKAPKTTEKE